MAMLLLRKIQIRYWVATGLVVAVLLGALNAMEPIIDIDCSSPATVGSASSDDVSAEATVVDRTSPSFFAGSTQCRDLILLLDPLQDEVGQIAFLGAHLCLAIAEEAAPIVVSTHILKNLLMARNAQRNGMVELLLSRWHAFNHKKSHLILLLPDAYLRSIPSAHPLSICGFNAAKLNLILPENLLAILSATTKKTSMPCIDGLTEMFLTRADAPTLHWNIYLAGHGLPAERASGILMLGTGQIAGLSYAEFYQLMSFLNGKKDNDIQASFLAYTTCFGGGTNQQFINKLLQDIKTSFIVAGQGINDTSVWIDFDLIAFNSSQGWHATGKLSFSKFFQYLHGFQNGFQIGTTFTTDPFKAILQPIYGKVSISNQPSIRLPHLGVFQLVTVDQQVKTLSNIQVKAHELGGNPIEIDANKTTFVVVPSHHVGVDINIDNCADIQCPAFIFPTNQTGDVVDRTLFHSFKKINLMVEEGENIIKFFLCSLIVGNKSMLPVTILVKSVNIFLPSADPIILENLMINIDCRKSLKNTDITIAYQCNGKVYSATTSYEWLTMLAASPLSSTVDRDKITLYGKLENLLLVPDLNERVIKQFFDGHIHPEINVLGSTPARILEDTFNLLYAKTNPSDVSGALAPNRIATRLMGLVERLEKESVPTDRKRKIEMRDYLARIKIHAIMLAESRQILRSEYTQIVAKIDAVSASIRLHEEEETKTDE